MPVPLRQRPTLLEPELLSPTLPVPVLEFPTLLVPAKPASLCSAWLANIERQHGELVSTPQETGHITAQQE